MGSYEREQRIIADGNGKRGLAAEEYFKKIDERLCAVDKAMQHRPDYSRTLYAKDNDDIYREFCEYIDCGEFDQIKDPVVIDGYTAKDIHKAMELKNDRGATIDAGAIYNLMAKLRKNPAVYEKVLGLSGGPDDDFGYKRTMYVQR